METDDNTALKSVILVTGASGAGRSTAINVLEDLGVEAIDNLPLSLLPRLLDGPPIGRPLAIGLDVRNREFSVEGLLQTFRSLGDDPGLMVDILFLECRADVLLRRYSETRRRHPLAPSETPEIGIAKEIEMLAPIRSQATLLVDTSELTPHNLREALQAWFDPNPAARLAVSVQSFSYKRGIPHGIDMVFDCRFLRNPHWDDSLREKDGRDRDVQQYVESDRLYASFFKQIFELVNLLLPAYRDEGKSYLNIGFGCTGGQHRSVALAEKLGNALAKDGWQASMRHRELERRARSVPLRDVGVSR